MYAIGICQKQFYLTEALKCLVISLFLDAVHEISYLLTKQRQYGKSYRVKDVEESWTCW